MTIFICNKCDQTVRCRLDAGDEPLDFYPEICPFDENYKPEWTIFTTEKPAQLETDLNTGSLCNEF